jgi:hypothetical protein
MMFSKKLEIYESNNSNKMWQNATVCENMRQLRQYGYIVSRCFGWYAVSLNVGCQFRYRGIRLDYFRFCFVIVSNLNRIADFACQLGGEALSSLANEVVVLPTAIHSVCFCWNRWTCVICFRGSFNYFRFCIVPTSRKSWCFLGRL